MARAPRFMTLPLPFFLIFCVGYFTISPWAYPLAQWICEHDFQTMRTAIGGDYDTCVTWFPWLMTLNNAFYVPLYIYSWRASISGCGATRGMTTRASGRAREVEAARTIIGCCSDESLSFVKVTKEATRDQSNGRHDHTR